MEWWNFIIGVVIFIVVRSNAPSYFSPLSYLSSLKVLFNGIIWKGSIEFLWSRRTGEKGGMVGVFMGACWGDD